MTTSGMCSAEPLTCAISALGTDRVMFAADYPFEATEEAGHFIDGAALAESPRRHLLQQCRTISRAQGALTRRSEEKQAGGRDGLRKRTFVGRRHRGTARTPSDLLVAGQGAHHRWRRHLLRCLRRIGDRIDPAGHRAALETDPAANRADDLGRLPRAIARRAVVRLDRRALRPNDGDDLVDRAVRDHEPRLRAGLGLQLPSGVPHHPGDRLGGEVPVAAVFISELAKAQGRGRFVLLYELVFPIGLVAASLVGLWVVPHLGWQYMFVIGALPALLTLALRRLLPESPRWLAVRGRDAEAQAAMTLIETETQKATGRPLPPPKPVVSTLRQASVACRPVRPALSCGARWSFG